WRASMTRASWGLPRVVQRRSPRIVRWQLRRRKHYPFDSCRTGHAACMRSSSCCFPMRRYLMPGRERLPDTLKRSPAKAQRTWAKAHDSAVREYGEGGRAHRVAFAALKHSFEKQGDHWVAKDHPGPSDPRAEKRGRAAQEGRGESFGGV